jgi:hypothetical protein
MISNISTYKMTLGSKENYINAAATKREVSVTPTFCKNKTFCANRSTYKIIVLVKNFPKINLA